MVDVWQSCADINRHDHLHIHIRILVSVDRRGSYRYVAWNGQGLESQPAPSLDQKWREAIGNGGGDETVLGPVRGDYRGEMRP